MNANTMMSTRTDSSGKPGVKTPALTVTDLRKEYGNPSDPVTAVDGVSFDVHDGEVVGLLGPNGAGKTTTIKACLGLVSPTSGTVRLKGVDVSENPRRVYEHVSAVLEGNRNVYWRLTVRENVNFFASLQGKNPRTERDRLDGIISRLGLEEKDDEPVRNLSRGMKQKVALACALARDTPILFLDEPTLGLDVGSSYDLRRELRRLVDEYEKTVVLSSHDMDVVESLCERVVVINDGAVVTDDAVDDLVDVFRTEVYRITIENDLSATALDALASRFGVEAWTTEGTHASADVLLDTPEQVYEIMRTLRTAGATPVAVTPTEPDLETVFLDLTSGDGTDIGDGESAQPPRFEAHRREVAR